MSNKKEIEKFTKEIEMPFLLHFTHISNLKSILNKGILSREKVDSLENEVVINDDLRLDNHRETISVSIAHPNDKMFYKYRDDDADWCVLAIKKSVLWNSECLFYKHNAASANVSHLEPEYLSSIDALKSMYEENELNSREEQCLKSFDPTDVQAEVLVKDIINPEDILGVVVSNRSVKKKYNNLIEEKNIKINSPNKGVYATRLYKRKWQ